MPTIFSVITGNINASVILLRISGKESLVCLKKLGVNKSLEPRKSSYSQIFDPLDNSLLDDCLITYFKAPHSFTGDDVVEIAIHGSNYILKRLTEILLSINNVRLAQAGEFSKIAFLNNKFDLTAAEGILDLINSQSKAQHDQALKQAQGKLGKIYDNWREKIIKILAHLEAVIDFPDEDLPQNLIDQINLQVNALKAQVKNHLNDNKCGQKLRDGLLIAIIGAPNVGKSTLMNYLAKDDVAIVSKQAGTTRDVIEIDLDLAGLPVRIADTAGIRDTKDDIEKQGIQRAVKKSAQADFRIIVFDSQNLSEGSNDKALDIKDDDLIILNKTDLQRPQIPKFLQACQNQVIEISLVKKINLDVLLDVITNKCQKILSVTDAPMITRARYRVVLEDFLVNLEEFSFDKEIEICAEILRICCQNIGQITGKIDVDELLDVIFNDFCIGK